MIQKKTRALLGEQRLTKRESYDEILTRTFIERSETSSKGD